jgi:ABC-type branched-subunit amino acid transport system ATPase component
MTVLENMLLAGKNKTGESVSGALFRWRQTSYTEKVNAKKALELLKWVGLEKHINEYSGNLSGGQKKLISLVRVLMADPKLILLDEPTAGVNPSLTREILETIKRLRDQGKTFLIIEHNMKVITAICDKVYVLDFGKKIAEGTPQEIQQDERVLRAYLSGKT